MTQRRRKGLNRNSKAIRSIKRRMALRQGGHWLGEVLMVPCHWCHRRHALGLMTFDHVVPKSLGGADAQANLVLSCRVCNERRGNGQPPVRTATGRAGPLTTNLGVAVLTKAREQLLLRTAFHVEHVPVLTST